MDITAEIVDMAHSLLAFHECRDRDKEDYNKFRRYVGRYAKNAKTIMQHICDMTPEPAILTSLENSDQARQHLRTFQERLNLVDN